MANNYLTMQLGNISFNLFDVSLHSYAPYAPFYRPIHPPRPPPPPPPPPPPHAPPPEEAPPPPEEAPPPPEVAPPPPEVAPPPPEVAPPPPEEAPQRWGTTRSVRLHSPFMTAHIPAAINSGLEKSSTYHWNFENASIFRSFSGICFRDSAHQNGTEFNGKEYQSFHVCASSGEGSVINVPLIVTDASLQGIATSKSLKSRGWLLQTDSEGPLESLSGRIHIAGDSSRTFAYRECDAMPCSNALWTALRSSRRSSWVLLPVVASPTLLSLFSSVPFFQGPTLQYQNGRVFAIGGILRSNSQFANQGRFTVGTYDLSVDSSRAVMNLFVYHAFSAIVDGSSSSNGTHAFIFGGNIGWGRSEKTLLVLTYSSMQVALLSPLPPSGPAAFFSGVN
jgi:hypothetical protein